MTIKSDRWIQEMAESHQMISPFEPGQVRTRDGEKLISYGTSSYGYDVRCADDFKVLRIFTRRLSIPRILMTKALSISKPMYALFRPIRLHWRAPLSISESLRMC